MAELGKLWEQRRLTFEELPNSDALRDHFKLIRSATLAEFGQASGDVREECNRSGRQSALGAGWGGRA